MLITNGTTTAVNLKGWTLTDTSSHTYTFATFTLGAGKTVTVKTGKGTNTATTLFQQRAAYVWNNDKDTATLRRANKTAGRVDEGAKPIDTRPGPFRTWGRWSVAASRRRAGSTGVGPGSGAKGPARLARSTIVAAKTRLMTTSASRSGWRGCRCSGWFPTCCA
ncbi:lamin tail domain-containing protein [Streptomyces sp. H27-H1]|uniref:lamin tail domain-containing protein n=1 Tax=Streptomyces sp. H27-H1 TaxID=2996461 RepID=UPI003B632682